MIKYFKRSLKHTHKQNNNNDCYQEKTHTSYSDKHKHKPHYHKDKVNEIASDMCTPEHKIDDTPNNTDIDSSITLQILVQTLNDYLGNMK